MKERCLISVVMSVYNDQPTLPQAMESILTQDDVDLELIVIIDGSKDQSRAIADRFAQEDGRVRVLARENRGLTDSLIEGCALARGEFIARQDADDFSLPGRLKKQVGILERHPETTLVGCGARFMTQEGHELYCAYPNVNKAMAQVAACRLPALQILCGHGTAMFRKSAYENVGGYRRQFRFGQDVDLWIRLLELGTLRSVNEILYVVRLSSRGVSALQRPEQIALAELALGAARARRNGLSEDSFLSVAAQISVSKRAEGSLHSRMREAGGLYFFGSCLLGRGDMLAKQYFLKSLLVWPFQIRSWYGLLRSW